MRQTTFAVITVIGLAFGFAGDAKSVQAQSPNPEGAAGRRCAECSTELKQCLAQTGTAVEKAVCVALYIVCENQVFNDTGENCPLPEAIRDLQ
jgi:hypothetical protein